MFDVLPETPKAIDEFCSQPLPFQQTVKTPLKDLSYFISRIIAVFDLHRAYVSTFQVAFEPKATLNLLASSSISLEDQWQFDLEAEGRDDIAQLLEALLSDWIDFAFIVSPPMFGIYADHDEYITFYSANREKLERLVEDLQIAGIQRIDGYRRPIEYWIRERDRIL